MTENFIQLDREDTLRLAIKDSEGNLTGEFLEFDLEDIELPLKYQELMEKHKKNLANTQNQLHVIEKRQDVKGKKLLTKNQEDEVRVLNEFFEKEVEIYNIFLGENGVQKILCGRKLGWTTLRSIDKIIKEQILPHLNVSKEKIEDKIKRMYSSTEEKGLLQ